MTTEDINKLKEDKEQLEQELFNQKLKGVNGQLVALGDTLHGRINDLEKKNDIQFKHVKEALDVIKDTGDKTLDQARRTNGRVTILESEKLPEKVVTIEKDTRVVRFMHKYPKISVGLGVILYLITIKEIRDTVSNAIGNVFQWIKVLL